MSTASTSAPSEPIAQEAIGRALVSGPRPPRATALTAVLAFGWRGMLKIKHVPEQLIDVTMTPVLFTLMFTYLFGGATAGGGKVNINTATPEELEALPGIGAVTVQKIVAARQERPFTSLEDAVERGVIHNGQLEDIRELATAG
jgi:hypothetical protein